MSFNFEFKANTKKAALDELEKRVAKESGIPDKFKPAVLDYADAVLDTLVVAANQDVAVGCNGHLPGTEQTAGSMNFWARAQAR